MVGVPPPASSLDKIAELLKKLDSNWFQQIQNEIKQHEFFDEEGGGVFLDDRFGDNDDDGANIGGSYYYLEWFTWNNKIPELNMPTASNNTYCGYEIFSQIVELTQGIIRIGASIREGYITITHVKQLCDDILLQILSESSDEKFKQVLIALRRRGAELLDRAFIDYTDTEALLFREGTIRFNLNQDTLAYFFAVLIKGGIIEQTKEEIAPLAQKYFLVKKEGETSYRTLSHFKKKLDNFFNGSGRSSDTPRETITTKINKGISAITL